MSLPVTQETQEAPLPSWVIAGIGVVLVATIVFVVIMVHAFLSVKPAELPDLPPRVMDTIDECYRAMPNCDFLPPKPSFSDRDVSYSYSVAAYLCGTQASSLRTVRGCVDKRMIDPTKVKDANFRKLYATDLKNLPSGFR